jgi:antitoxin (DNA-binding transcriptional repressor) of toxin-antitoxin stability system
MGMSGNSVRVHLCTLWPVAEIGIRDLRADLATHVRRAAAGETVRIRVNGRAIAVLGAIDASAVELTIAQLVASESLIAPRRADGAVADGAIRVWRQVRLDLALREIRG